MILGIIADDFTGATDVASMLVRAGLRTVQVIGVPRAPPPDADAVVVALKTRTVPASDAVRESLAALRWLQTGGMRQCYFKYCSTFDSTPAGNIGPVTEALMNALGAPFTIACPAFPENGRTVFRGHLFVGDVLLSDSGMREHPLTPMTDSNLVRVLQAQTTRRVGLLRHDVIHQGVAATRSRIEALKHEGHTVAIADALSDADLHTLAAACAELPLVTAGSGLALGLGAVVAERGWLVPDARAATLEPVRGRSAVIAGSCSVATQAQVARWREAGRPAFTVDARAVALGKPVASQALAWARTQAADAAVLIHATTSSNALRSVQAEFGAMAVGAQIEACLAEIAVGLVTAGVRRLIVAGGETSGAVVQALGITRLRIGPAICPGVPWTQAEAVAADSPAHLPFDSPLHLALKSGNFGSVDFFDDALRLDPSA